MDIKDLLESFSDEKYTNLRAHLSSIMEHPEFHSTYCRAFVGQRALYDEIKNHILHPASRFAPVYFIFDGCLEDDEKTSMVWLLNPNHREYLMNDSDYLPSFFNVRIADIGAPFVYHTTRHCNLQDNEINLVVFEINSNVFSEYFSEHRATDNNATETEEQFIQRMKQYDWGNLDSAPSFMTDITNKGIIEYL